MVRGFKKPFFIFVPWSLCESYYEMCFLQNTSGDGSVVPGIATFRADLSRNMADDYNSLHNVFGMQ